jgi:hypothetical protein
MYCNTTLIYILEFNNVSCFYCSNFICYHELCLRDRWWTVQLVRLCKGTAVPATLKPNVADKLQCIITYQPLISHLISAQLSCISLRGKCCSGPVTEILIHIFTKVQTAGSAISNTTLKFQMCSNPSSISHTASNKKNLKPLLLRYCKFK